MDIELDKQFFDDNKLPYSYISQQKSIYTMDDKELSLTYLNTIHAKYAKNNQSITGKGSGKKPKSKNFLFKKI